jgi:hypothetical protein
MYDFSFLTTSDLFIFINLQQQCNMNEYVYVANGAWAYKGFSNNKHQYQLVFNADHSKTDEFYVMTGTIGFDAEGALVFELGMIVANNLTEDQAIRFILD